MSLYTRFCEAKQGSSGCNKERKIYLNICKICIFSLLLVIRVKTHRGMRPIGVIKTEGLCWFLWGFRVEDSCGGGTKLVMGLIFSRLS